ncbi:hypothetical protein [Mycolicibacterium llatzerense]|uniref:hypothetical protein n=1 Tax=Mycolicibacterium llatzerense TaxID=280871 RepID=UPI0031E208AA
MSLPSFTFTGNLKAIGVAVSGVLSESALVKAQVQFTSNLKRDRLLVFGGTSYSPPDTVYGDVSDTGQIFANDGTTNPVKLLASSSGLSASGIQWTATVLIPASVGTQKVTYTFEAPQDGDTIDLTTVIANSTTPAYPTYGEDDITLIDGGAP